MRSVRGAGVGLLVLIAAGTATSGATYTASSDNPQALGAAADFGLSASLSDPGSPLRGTVALSATATSTDGAGVAQVVIERSPAGTGSWTAICTDTVAPYSCSLDTTGLANGQYDLRAAATNGNGYTRISPVVAGRLVDNAAPSVTLADPGAWFGGTLTLSTASLSDNSGGSGIANVRYEYKSSAGSTWSTACTASASPFECSFVTTSLTDGTNYDFRVVATDAAGNATTSVAITNRRADNGSPSGSITDPGTNLRGTVTLTGTASDAVSGVASARMQYSVAGANSWSDACVDTTAPFSSCSWDTTLLNGLYDVRTVVTDVAGNTYTSSAVANRRIDNLPPATSMADPGPYLRGSMTFSATATETGGSGLTSLRIQYSAAGAGTWADICTSATSPLSCPVNTTGVADGTYDLRAIGTDLAGNTGTHVHAGRIVDNTAPTAVDIQSGNGGTTPGRIDPTDHLTFTFSETMKATSILAGWDGSATAVAVFVDNRNPSDRLYVYDAAKSSVLPLAAEVLLNRDYVSADTWFTASMTQTGATIRVTLVALESGTLLTPGGTPTMSWSPSASATDPAGNPMGTTARSEQGTADTDF